MKTFRILSGKTFLRNDKGEKVLLKKRQNGSLYLKFNWKNGIKYKELPVDMKMIPKEEKTKGYFLEDKPIYSIVRSDGTELLIQSITGDLSFLSIDDEGIVSPKKLNELSDDEPLIIYNEDDVNDWAIDDIDELAVLDIDSKEDIGSLSNYIFLIEDGNGIVLNDFLIC